MNPSELDGRVRREHEAHTEHDVLAESYRLKERFRAVFDAPHVKRLDARWIELLENPEGLRILDYGCGRGGLGIELARKGALVTGVDISESYVEEANASANEQGLPNALFLTADAHATGLPDSTFDMVIGEGVLHHLDIARAAAEIHRVLKPGGMALFKEPLVGPPWLRIFRILTPKARTLDERPFEERDLKLFDRSFDVKSQYYGILVPLVAGIFAFSKAAIDIGGVLTPLDKIDLIIGKIPATRSWHQYVLLRLGKRLEAEAS